MVKHFGKLKVVSANAKQILLPSNSTPGYIPNKNECLLVLVAVSMNCNGWR